MSLGETAMEKLPARASEIQALISQFAAKTLTQVSAEFEAAVASGVVNAEVTKLSALVRDQAAQTIEDLKAIDMWLACKMPEVSDGNNFGVDVQVHVTEQLAKLRAECVAMLDAASTYHKTRSEGLEGKVVQVPTTSTDTMKEASKVTGGKDGPTDTKTEKTTAVEKTTAKAPLPDQIKYVAELDTKEYHACYLRLTDLRNIYVKSSMIVGKNKKRLADPRGDGDGSRSNAMSMF